MIKHVVFDRDGTLINFIHYLTRNDQIKINTDFVPFILHLLSRDVLFSLHTNQSGIEKGLITFNDVLIHNAHVEHLLSQYTSTSFRFCEQFVAPSIEHEYRKPTDLVLTRLIKEYALANDEILMVGDTEADYLCTERLCLPFLFYRGTNAKPDIGNAVLHRGAIYCNNTEDLINGFNAFNV